MSAAALRDGPAPGSGPLRWFDKSAGAALDRLPRFDDAMTSVARALAEGLGSLSASPVDVGFAGVRPGRLDALLARRGASAVLAVAHAAEWDAAVGLHFDRTLVAAVVEAFFGGGGEDAPILERDSLSAVETRIADVIAEQALEAMTKGFDDVLPTRFTLEPIRPKPDPGLLGKPAVPVLIATLALQAVGRQAELDFVVPRSALERIKDRPACAPETHDSGWAERLEAEVGRASMRVQASMDLCAMSLRDLADLQPGQVLALPVGAKANVGLRCGADRLFRCELGQSAGFYTVRIEEPIEAPASPSHKTG